MVQTLRFGTDSLPIHPGRYRLVVSPLCPFCRRVTITHRLLELQAAIPLTLATSKGADGFIFESPGFSYNTEINARTSRELYRRQPDWEVGQSTTIPIILDQKDNHRIVSHESDDIAHDFFTAWKPFWGLKVPDLYPEALREQIDKWNADADQVLFAPLLKVFHQALPTEQREPLLAALKDLDNQFSHSEYLFGDEPTYCDIRIYSHLQAAHLAEPQLLEDYPHIKAFFEKAWADPRWTSAEERQVLDPNLAGQENRADQDGNSGQNATNQGDSCGITTQSDACSVPTPSSDACSL